MTERKLCSNCGYQKSVGVSIACQRCFNKSLWKPRNKTMREKPKKNHWYEMYKLECLRTKELQEENKKTFNDWIEACNKYGEVNLKLTNAKEIISEYINILKGDTKNWKKTQEKAEQFISEVEK